MTSEATILGQQDKPRVKSDRNPLSWWTWTQHRLGYSHSAAFGHITSTFTGIREAGIALGKNGANCKSGDFASEETGGGKGIGSSCGSHYRHNVSWLGTCWLG